MVSLQDARPQNVSNDSHIGSLIDLSEQCGYLKGKIEDLKAKTEQLDNNLKTTENERNEYHSRMINIEQENSALKRELYELRLQCVDLQTEVKQSETIVRKIIEEKSELTKKCNAEEDRVSILEQEMKHHLLHNKYQRFLLKKDGDDWKVFQRLT